MNGEKLDSAQGGIFCNDDDDDDNDDDDDDDKQDTKDDNTGDHEILSTSNLGLC